MLIALERKHQSPTVPVEQRLSKAYVSSIQAAGLLPMVPNVSHTLSKPSTPVHLGLLQSSRQSDRATSLQ